MNKTILLTFAAAGVLAAGQDDSFLLRGATIHPVSGPKVENGMVLVIDGKISEIGLKIQSKAKVRIVEGKGMHVYPGFIDSGSPVGLQEVASVRETNDTGELGMFNPQLKAISAVNPESDHIPVIRANGTTLVQIMPGVGGGQGQTGIIGGQTSLVHLTGYTWEEMQTTPYAALEVNWPVPAQGGGRGGGGGFPGGAGQRPSSFSQANRAKEENIQQLTEFVEQARRYQAAKKAGPVAVDRKFEAVLPVLEGSKPLLVSAARERAIREAVAWAEKQKIRVVISKITQPGKMIEELGKKKIPVILGTPYGSMEEDDPYDDPFTLPARLHQAGVEFAYGSFGVQFARNLPFQAGQAVAFGLPYEVALKSITMTPAKIWGIADRYGSIEVGKMADLIVTDGDPLEPRSSVKMMFIQGRQTDLESKHTRLYKKYMERP